MPATDVSYVLYMNYYRERERKKKTVGFGAPQKRSPCVYVGKIFLGEHGPRPLLILHAVYNLGYTTIKSLATALSCVSICIQLYLTLVVSEHCKVNLVTALDVRFSTFPVKQTRACRSTILGLRIVQMGRYCFCISVAPRSHNLAAKESQTQNRINMTWRMLLRAVVATAPQ